MDLFRAHIPHIFFIDNLWVFPPAPIGTPPPVLKLPVLIWEIPSTYLLHLTTTSAKPPTSVPSLALLRLYHSHVFTLYYEDASDFHLWDSLM